MSAGLVKTKNTRLYFTSTGDASSSDSDGVVIHRVYCPTGIQNIGGGAKAKVTATCLDSERQEYVGGLPDNEELTVPFNVAFRSAAFQALLTLFDEGDEENLSSFMIVYPKADGTPGTAPTSIDSDGRLVSPGDTTEEVQGYIANMTREAATSEIQRGTLTIQTSGTWRRDLPAADL